MRRGRPRKPTISSESVDAALKTLGHRSSEVPEAVALQQLAIVDLYLENPARPPTEDLRGWALRALLTEIISEELSNQRRYFDLAPASIKENRRTALERIKLDSQQNSSVLLGWSILFYRYVRSDLAFTVQELVEFTNVHERTIRRERNDSILRLRDSLASAEWEARRINQRRMLRASIPERLVNLIERDAQLNLVFNTLQKTKTSHFFVTGAAGIGKSAFVAAIAHQLIENDDLDFIVWLTKPQRIADVKNTVEDTLLPYPSQAELSALLLEFRTLVVIDDAETLIMNSEEWLDLMRYLNHALVIICNREHILFPHPVIHIPIQELSEFGIYELIGTYPSIETLDETLQKQIWQTVGGNPRGIDYALRQIANGNQIQFGDLALRSIYDELFKQLDDKQRGAWILFAVLSVGIHVDKLSFVLNTDNRFFDYGLLETLDGNSQIVRLIPSARRYIEIIAESDKNISNFASEQIEMLIKQKSSLPQSASDIFLAVLECRWLEIDANLSLSILCSCDTRILTLPQLRKWWQLVETCDEELLELLLLKGVAARRLQNHTVALSIFESIIQQTGQSGDFNQQAVARYELAVLHQARAEFDKAIGIYQELEKYLPHINNRELARQIKRQQARIAIENRNADKALSYLESRSHSIQDGVLLCEALLIQGHGDLCRSNSRKYLQEAQDEPVLASSLYTIIGRSYEQEGQIDEALDYLNAALALTERFSTEFDIARAQCNLASVYLQLEAKESLNQAEELLRQAHATQSLIKDTVGLFITQRNLQYLNTLRLSR